jgi:chromosomal replication initiation ATPase DnaA
MQTNLRQSPAGGRILPLRDIQLAVCKECGITMPELLGSRRARHIARPRQIGMYLGLRMARASTTRIGARFGERDHTTVIHARKKIESILNNPEHVEHREVMLTVVRCKEAANETARGRGAAFHTPLREAKTEAEMFRAVGDMW